MNLCLPADMLATHLHLSLPPAFRCLGVLVSQTCSALFLPHVEEREEERRREDEEREEEEEQRHNTRTATLAQPAAARDILLT